jgi:hypothetical protein
MTEPKPEPALVKVSKQYYEFTNKNVQMLHGLDFKLHEDTKICLRITDCCVVLFFVDNQESNDLAILWSMVANKVPGPKYAAVDMVTEREVAAAFAEVIARPRNHPFHWAGLRQYPFILVYRNGFPTACYNGPRNTQALTDFILLLACNSSYIEPVQNSASMVLDKNDDLKIPDETNFIAEKKNIETSTQLTEAIRNYGKPVNPPPTK